MITLEDQRICYALKFEFCTMNNEAKYKALIAELNILRELRVKMLRIFSDYQLVVYQAKKDFKLRASG